MAVKWNWRRKSDGEPMTVLAVRHYLTRDDMITLLCARMSIGTGTKLSQRATLDAIRDELRDATVHEAVEYWAEAFPAEEADPRIAWAAEQVARL